MSSMAWMLIFAAFVVGLALGIWLGIASVSNSMEGY